MDYRELRGKAVRERFPFLKQHISTEADVQIEPIEVDLAHKQPKRDSGESDDGWYSIIIDIFLLNQSGEKIGTVGKVPKLRPALKFWGVTWLKEKMVIRKISETTQEALNRVEGVFYILVRESRSYQNEEASLYLPPEGQTAKGYLAHLLTEARLKKELRLKRIEEESIAISQRKEREIQEALDAESARLDDLLREIKGTKNKE